MSTKCISSCLAVWASTPGPPWYWCLKTELNGGHVGVTNQSCGSWTLLLRKRRSEHRLEHRNGIARSRVQASGFTGSGFSGFLRNCINCVHNCEDHSSFETFFSSNWFTWASEWKGSIFKTKIVLHKIVLTLMISRRSSMKRWPYIGVPLRNIPQRVNSFLM